MRIAVANLKGGAAKTTSAVLLAEAAAAAGSATLLVDADPQGSAMAWAGDADEDGGPGLRCITVALPTADVGRRLAGIADSHDLVVIDTPPGLAAIVQAAIAAADVVLIPCQPTLMDLCRMHATIGMASDAGKPAALLLCRARSGTRSLAAAQSALHDADLPLLEAVIPQREAIAAAFGTRPGRPALEPYRTALDELTAALTPKRRRK